MALPEWIKKSLAEYGRQTFGDLDPIVAEGAQPPPRHELNRLVAKALAARMAALPAVDATPEIIKAMEDNFNTRLMYGETADDIVKTFTADAFKAVTSGVPKLGLIEQTQQTEQKEREEAAKKLPPNSSSLDARLAAQGFARLSDGTYFNNMSGIILDASGNNPSRVGAGGGASAGRDSAAMEQDRAATRLADAQTERLARLATLAGTRVPGSPEGQTLYYDADGSVKDMTPYEAQRAKALADQNKEVNDIARKAEINTDFVARGRLAVEGRNADNTNTYQMGVLSQGNQRLTLDSAKNAADALFQQGQLSQGAQRLGLDTATARADAESKAQQNNLARQTYVGKVLSSPSDFIARAFMQRGESSPSAPITQADLINQVNTDYYKSPLSFSAPVSTPGAPETMQPNLPQQPPTMAYGSPPAYAHGTPAAPQQDRLQKRTEGVRKLLQHVQNPQTLHQLVDELTEQEGRLSTQNVPQYARGTPVPVGQPGEDPKYEQMYRQMIASGVEGNNALRMMYAMRTSDNAMRENEAYRQQAVAPALPSMPQATPVGAGRPQNGMVRDTVAIVGDPQSDGEPNPELIRNPTGAPISVTPLKGAQSSGGYPVNEGDMGGLSEPAGPSYGAFYDQGDMGGARNDYTASEFDRSVDPTGSKSRLSNKTNQRRLESYDKRLEDIASLVKRFGSAYADKMLPGWREIVSQGNSLPSLPMYANGTGLQADASGNFTFNGRSITNADINGTSTAPISSTTPSTVTSPKYPVGNPTGVSPASVSMNRMQGPVYDFYNKETGEAGYNDPKQVSVPMPTMSGNRGGQSNSSLTPTSSAYDYRIPDVQLIQPRLAPPRATQAELVSRAESTLPPALRQLFGGINPAMNTVDNATNNPQNPTGINPLRFGFNLFSPEALSNLTEAEKQALNSYLGVKYNTSLEDVMTGMRQSYTGPRIRTGRLARAK